MTLAATKDCLEDLQVFFTTAQQPIVDQAISVKARKVEVLNVYLAVEPVPFNKGFYSVDMTFFLGSAYPATPHPLPSVPVEGLATFSKKVILYGSEGNVKVYTSDLTRSDDCRVVNNMPKASVQVCAHKPPFSLGNISLGRGFSPQFGGFEVEISETVWTHLRHRPVRGSGQRGHRPAHPATSSGC